MLARAAAGLARSVGTSAAHAAPTALGWTRRVARTRGMASFVELGVPPHLISRMARNMQIHEPTPVQEAALQLLMPARGGAQRTPPRSVVVRWPTGSGKTLSYMLPMMARIDPSAFGVQAVIVAPTRELCLQTLRVLKVLSDHGRANRKGHSVTVMSVMGRVNTKMESELQHHPPHILVGTPQPLGALLFSGVVPLTKNVAGRTLILDEVDALAQRFRWPHLLRVLAAPPPLQVEPPTRRKGGKGSAAARRPSLAPQHVVSGAGTLPLAPPPPTAGRGAWCHGAVWLVSANAQRDGCARALEQAGHAPKAPLVACAARLPDTLRHVLLPPSGVGLADVARGLVRGHAAGFAGRKPVGVRALPSSPGGESGWQTVRSSAGEAVAADHATEGAGGAQAGSGYAGGAGIAPAAADSADYVCASDRGTATEGREGWPPATIGMSAVHGIAPVTPAGAHGVSSLPGLPEGAGSSSTPPSARRAQVLVFVESGSAAQRLVTELDRAPRVAAAAVHAADGAVSESKRERHRAMKGFADGRVRVLAATEGMAHGVDFKGATHVVNASMPADAGAYLHRAGRTGRTGGGGGTVVSLPASAEEVRTYHRWARELGITMEEVAVEAGQQGLGDILAVRLGDPLSASEGDAPAAQAAALEAAGDG